MSESLSSGAEVITIGLAQLRLANAGKESCTMHVGA
jgi:hypothetical protein